MPIHTYGKGAVRQPSATINKISLMGIAPVNWTKGFSLPVPPDTDQGQADCCVGEGTSSYHWQLEKTQFSVRSVFANIAQPYGASIADGPTWVVNHGQETVAECPDPSPKTALNMRSKTGLNTAIAARHEERESFELPDDSIDGVAWGIQNYQGVVFGVVGSDNGWEDMENPIPPQKGETTWGHCLYAMGFHLQNGTKCIICKSSWCNEVKEHHIKENYFISGNTFNAYTLIPKGTLVNNFVTTMNYNGTIGLFLPVSSPEQIALLNNIFNTQIVVNPDGSIPTQKTVTDK